MGYKFSIFLNLFSLLGKLIRPLLFPIAALYGGIMWVRNRAYDNNVYASIEFDLPVISVGNLSTGGTGKTPHVEYLIRLLQYHYRLATMSRGYKRRTQGFKLADAKTNAFVIGDEPMQYHQKFPEVVVSVCEDRLTGIPYLLSQRPDIDVLLLDDAYQHRSVKPGLNILITDYSRPFYKDFILPFGRLRESRKTYQRADIIIMSKCPVSLSQSEAAELRIKINPQPHQEVFFSTVAYAQSYEAISRQAVQLAADTQIILLTGIAKPEPLLTHLQTQVASVHLLRHPDHHYFSTKDIEELRQAYENLPIGNRAIATTEKDYTRLSIHKELLANLGLSIIVMPIEIKILFDESHFEQRVYAYLKSIITEPEVYYEEVE